MIRASRPDVAPEGAYARHGVGARGVEQVKRELGARGHIVQWGARRHAGNSA